MPPTLDQVKADLDAVLKRQPMCARAYYLRGLLRARRQKRDDAIADFTEVIQLDKKHARAYYGRGLLYAEKGKFARAKEDLDRALKLNPGLFPDSRR
jgi:tetratricopeptide (TPR) repeat protein